MSRCAIGFDVSEHDALLLKELCRLQDEYLERIPKLLGDRTLGLALEGNMDILREVSCRVFRDPEGNWCCRADAGYLSEKYVAMTRDLSDLGLL